MVTVRAFAIATIALIAAVASSPIQAKAIFTYIGQVTHLEYNNLPQNTASPFALGQTVTGILELEIYGRQFGIYNGILYISEPSGVKTYQDFNVSGFVQFGDAGERASFGPAMVGFALKGNLSESNGQLIEHADFCCGFSSYGAGYENGQTVFEGDNFRAAYRPTGQTDTNVSVWGTGIWAVRVIPEPQSLALLCTAVFILLMIRHRNLRRKAV
ncbi:hypothetical protein [Elioraea rosea]|uniref:hypothetical protein n=1 Tax=Elioraea rosea TaxID=2492390 RepID=UPI001184A194|nr:hypothetical protein [Elioraea rosea]